MAVKNIVAKHQRAGTVGQKVLGDDECLRQAIGPLLHRIGQRNTPLTSVTQQLLKARRVLGRGDEQDVADTREQQRA